MKVPKFALKEVEGPIAYVRRRIREEREARKVASAARAETERLNMIRQRQYELDLLRAHPAQPGQAEAPTGGLADALRAEMAQQHQALLGRVSDMLAMYDAPAEVSHDDFRKIAEDLVELKNKVAALAGRPQVLPPVVGTPGDFSALSTRMDALEAAIVAGPPVDVPAVILEPLTRRLDKLEAGWNAFQELVSRVKTVESKVTALDGEVGLSAVELSHVKAAGQAEAELVLEHETRMDALEKKAAELEKQLIIEAPPDLDLTAGKSR